MQGALPGHCEVRNRSNGFPSSTPRGLAFRDNGFLRIRAIGAAYGALVANELASAIKALADVTTWRPHLAAWPAVFRLDRLHELKRFVQSAFDLGGGPLPLLLGGGHGVGGQVRDLRHLSLATVSAFRALHPLAR